MPDSTPLTSSITAARAALMFPTLTDAQIARILPHGLRRTTAAGEVLIEAGAPSRSFFVVAAGRIEVVRPSTMADQMVAVHGPGAFTGEANMLLGRPSMMRT